MPHISYLNREISFKLVYYGPGFGGKTTNLIHLHRALGEDLRGDLITLKTEEERTLFFDFLPVRLGQVAGYAVRFSVYTVPGQLYYEASRRLILEGADGVVFVADSQPERLDANLMSFRLMQENLASYGVDWSAFPLALQYNKRDMRDPIPVGTLERALCLNGIPVVEAVAVEGRGVLETTSVITRRIIERFQI
jgi:mutual gliding-motility protein MglA